ncbi:hypothetical protein Tco_0934466 [Tanacetum coccineum]
MSTHKSMTISQVVKDMLLAALGDVRTLIMDEAYESTVLGASRERIKRSMTDRRYIWFGHLWAWSAVSIISDRDGRFTLRVLANITEKALGTRLDMSMAYHPLDGWGKAEIGESMLIGPELVQETTDKVVLIKEKLKAARDRQKSYADNRRKPLKFEVEDQVLLKVSPWKEEIKVDKTLHFVEEPVEIIDREVKSLKRSRIPIVKVN